MTVKIVDPQGGNIAPSLNLATVPNPGDIISARDGTEHVVLPGRRFCYRASEVANHGTYCVIELVAKPATK